MSKETIDLSGITGRNRSKSTDTSTNKNSRKAVSISEIVENNGAVDDLHTPKTESNLTYQESLLDINNPNSMFMKHLQSKTAEMNEWVAEKEEEKKELEALARENEDDTEDDDMNNDVVIDAVSNTGVMEEEDINNPEMIEEDLSNSDVIEYDITGEGIEDEEESSELSREELTHVLSDISSDDDEEDDDEDELVDEIDEDDEDDDDEGYTDEEEDFSEDDTSEEEIETPALDLLNEGIEEEDTEEEKVEEAPAKEKVVKDSKPVAPPKKELVSGPEINLEMSEEDENTKDDIVDKDEDENELSEEDTALRAKLKKIAIERLKPASMGYDLSSFTVVKKPKVNADNIFKSYKSKVSKWVLFNQKCTVKMKEYAGSELELMMEYYQTSRRSVDSMRRMLHMIYDHIVSAKPASFETWLKITPYSDIDNYFFAIYIANFNGANYIPIDCTGTEGCGNSHITEDLPIVDTMVKFDSTEKKKEFEKIYKSEVPPQSKGLYVTEIIPLSRKVAIGFKEPSLWDRLSIDLIDDRTADEYGNIVAWLPYIDNIYEIDAASKQLIPIGYKTYADNESRTLRSKIRKYNDIFNSLSSDEFSPVRAYINDLSDKFDRGITYILPESECPDCGRIIPETEIPLGQVADMVFTRCQLGTLATTSIN